MVKTIREDKNNIPLFSLLTPKGDFHSLWKPVYLPYMIQRLFGVLLFFLLPQTGYNALRDSLNNAAQRSISDSNRIIAWIELNKIVQEEFPDSGIHFLVQTNKIPFQPNLLPYLAKVEHEKGICYDYAGKFDSSLYYLKRADSMYTSLRMFERKAAVLSDLGSIYLPRGNYEIALRWYMQSLDWMKKYSSSKSISKVLNNIGLVFRSKKDYSRSIAYYTQSLSIKNELKDSMGILNTTLNLGSLYLNRDLFDSAYYLFQKVEKLAKQMHNEKDLLNAHLNMAACLVSMDRLPETQALLSSVEQHPILAQRKNLMLTFLETKASLYKKNRKHAEALNYYQQALNLAIELNNLEAQVSFCKSIATLYQYVGNYQMAYEYASKAAQLSDSLLNEENVKQINQMSLLYETEEKEKAIHQLKSTNADNLITIQSKNKERNYFIAASLIFLILSCSLYYAVRINKKKNKTLDEKNSIIQEQLSENQLLMKEIHHRTKNNLQIVSSLLSLQSNYITDPMALQAVNESKNRVQAIAIIHQNLYQDKSLLQIDVREYIEQLVQYLKASYQSVNKQIVIETEIETQQLDIDILLPIGLIINELVNNSFKYAFHETPEGRIKIQITKEAQGLRIRVMDNGTGPERDQPTTSGFGYKMIQMFVKKMKGSLDIVREDGYKTTIYLQLPEEV